MARPGGFSCGLPWLSDSPDLRPRLLTLTCLLLTVLPVQDAPGPVDSTPRARTSVLPVVSYSEVTGIQYGATVFRSFRVGADSRTRASSVAIYGARTGKGHAKTYFQFERWSDRNGLRARARIEHLSYPLPYFGIGASAPESAEEWYSNGVTTVHLLAQQEWRPATFLYGGLRHIRTHAHEREPSGVIAAGGLAGSSGGQVMATELGVVIDARDNLGTPRTGTYARVISSVAARVLGADFSFRRLTIDARRYTTLGTNLVSAVQVQYDGVAGTVPFDQLPQIGADSAMRGYPRGRYRDHHAFTAQAELRTGYWKRVGAVAFIGAGTVASGSSDLADGPWYPSAGVGLRALLVPRDRTVARVDLGFGRGSFGINVGIGEAF